MEVKDFLKQYLKFEGLKKDYINEISAITLQCQKLTSSDDEYVLAMMEKEKIKTEIEKILTLQQSIEGAVFALSDGVERRVMSLRYLQGFSYIKISVEMSMCQSSIYSIHARAIKKMQIPKAWSLLE